MEPARDQRFLLRPGRPHPIRVCCLACCLQVLRETSVLTRPNENIGNNTLPLPVSLIMYLNWIVESPCRFSAPLDVVEAKFQLPAVSWWVGFASSQRKHHLLLFLLVCVCNETPLVQGLVFFSIICSVLIKKNSQYWLLQAFCWLHTYYPFEIRSKS